ncbi:MAG TPA: hypothetical protein VH092_23755 [Urbifossiella sp.]|jgi:hypothetical protein|nr:hypothetical protein [Urbifossiella sp.]
MARAERDALRVDVPVGFLLAEPQEVVVSVDRPEAAPLAIRLRLIPAATDRPDFGGDPSRSAHDTPAPVRRLPRLRPVEADHDLGGSD